MPNRTLDVLYADDIRHEIGGKISYMGVYNNELWAESFPFTMPKLAIAFWIRLPVQNLCEDLTFRIFKDDDLVYEQAFTDVRPPTETDFWEQPRPDGTESFVLVHSAVVFSPMTFEEPCLLRVRVDTIDADQIRGPGLRIRLPPDGIALRTI
jgi:hypothetical protein